MNKTPIKSPGKTKLKQCVYLNKQPINHLDHTLLPEYTISLPTPTTVNFSTYMYINYYQPHLKLSPTTVTPTNYKNYSRNITQYAK